MVDGNFDLSSFCRLNYVDGNFNDKITKFSSKSKVAPYLTAGRFFGKIEKL